MPAPVPMTLQPAEEDYSVRILWSLARWIEDTKGNDALAEVAACVGLTAADFDAASKSWLSHAQLEKVLACAWELTGDEATFRSVFAHRFKESYGAFRYMVWAVSQQKMNQLAISLTPKIITRVGRFETLYSTRNSMGLRYTSSRPESRLVCITRQVAWSSAPTLTGLPSGELVERACIANGDPYCEYHMTWLDERGIVPVLVGLGAGVASAALAAAWIDPSYVSAALLPVLGAVLGYLRETRRVTRVHAQQAEGRGTAMRVLAEAEAETRSEMLAMQKREHDWSIRVEEQANERNATLERVVGGLDDIQQSRVSSIRGFSHDLRNPLFVVRANTEALRARLDARGSGDKDEVEILQDIDAASLQMESMLSKLMEVATAETALVKLAPEPLEVAPLADTLRRRLKALVHGRGIEVSVVSTRDAPDEIVIDPLVFDRVVDNLLTNAAKYTDRGSIQLVLGADDHGSLELVLSDTGRGIAEDQIERIFRPRPADEPKGPNSYGIGLSSAVRLLGQIGGRLEVTSQSGVGTTFSAQFPTAPPASRRSSPGDETMESVISRVVKIRHAA